MSNLDEFPCDGRSLRPGILLPYFIAHTPQEHRRPVAIALHERAEVLFMPIRKNQVKVVRRLHAVPDIKDLIHHKEAHSVRQVE